MSFFPIPIPGFGGLNLADDPGDVGFGGAIDMANVDLDQAGRVRSRDFFGTYIANTTLTNPYPFIWPGTQYLLAADTANIKLYQGSGLIGTATVPAGSVFSYGQPFGTASASFLYLPDQAAANTIRKLTTAGVISAPAGMPKATLLARTPWDNRLVAANIGAVPTGSGATASTSLVHFSAAGDAETWGANDYIQLDPGDGDDITGACVWRDLLFIFKRTKFYVFYGTSTDASGNPIFNYRTIRTGVGGFPAAGYEGVYFISAQSPFHVYRTTGGPAEPISRPIDPSLNGTAPSTFTAGNIGTLPAPAFGDRRLYVGTNFLGGGNAGFFVYDELLGAWLFYTAKNSTFPRFDVLPNGHLLVAGDAAAPLYRVDPSYSAETYLASFTSYYQSGFENLAPPRRYIDRYGFGPSRKRIRAWRVKGSGTVTMAVAADFGATVGATALTLGTAPAVAEARYARAIRGSKISYKLSGSSAWSVNEMVAFLADTRGVAEDVSADA